jgi:hypothetical protein
MSQGIFKTGEAIDVTYQAAKLTTGLTDVVMKIYDETRVLDGVNFPDVTMTEIGATGRYYGSFTPDAAGVWTIFVNSVTKSSPVVKTFLVCTANLESITAGIAALNDLSAAEVNSEVASALSTYNAATGTDVSTTESNIRGTDSDTLKTLSDQVDGIESPAMLG